MRAFACLVFVCCIVGCQSTPPANEAALQVRVIATPKAGVHEHFVHVNGYDIAPSRPRPSGAFEQVDYDNVDNIIVWLEPIDSTSPQSSSSRAIVKLDPGKPRSEIVPVCIGAHVQLMNGSARAISVYSVSDGNEFDFKSLQPGASAEFVVKSEGQIEVLTDPSQPPVRTLYAVDGVQFMRARSGETIKFDPVPPGKYRLLTWHPRLPGTSQEITLTGGELSRVVVSVSVNSLPHAP